MPTWSLFWKACAVMTLLLRCNPNCDVTTTTGKSVKRLEMATPSVFTPVSFLAPLCQIVEILLHQSATKLYTSFNFENLFFSLNKFDIGLLGGHGALSFLHAGDVLLQIELSNSRLGGQASSTIADTMITEFIRVTETITEISPPC